MFNTLLSYVGAGPLSPRSNRQSLGPRDASEVVGRSRSVSPPYLRMDYSLTGFQDLVGDLIAIAGDAENPVHTITAPPAKLVEVVRGIAETLLWGEQNEEDSLMFDYFCEMGVMKIFVSLLNSPTVLTGGAMFSRTSNTLGGRQIKIQLLQTMSLLVLNIKRQTSLYYLFSNNAINMLINNNSNLDFSDEEILSYYVSFMKSISLRLSPETIKLFINDKQNYFPLFVQSIRFFDHHDRMIRNAVRTITLSVFKLMAQSPSLARIVQENAGGYFTLLACQLRDVWLLLDKYTAPHMSVVIEELIDQLEYIADIDRLGFTDLSALLVEKVSLFAIDSVLLKSMSDTSEAEIKLSLSTSLFVICRIIQIWPERGELVLKTEFNMQKSISKISSEFKHILVLFIFLNDMKDNSLVTRFGLFPPGSIDLTLLVSQSLVKTIDRFTIDTVKLVAYYLYIVLKDSLPEFDRPLRLTIIDSFKHVCLQIASVMETTISVDASNIDYGVIDTIEECLDRTFLFPTQSEIEKLSVQPSMFAPSVSLNVLDPSNIHVVLELFIQQLFCVEYLLGGVKTDLHANFFGPCQISCPFLVDLGSQSRIACTHITPITRSTRYMLMDPTRLVLVAPDLTKPGFAQVKQETLLRRIKSVSVDIIDRKILRIAPVGSEPIILAFEDLKRCQLAFVHLETHRTEIRHKIFQQIQTYIKGFSIQ